jgi:hypothetical protein
MAQSKDAAPISTPALCGLGHGVHGQMNDSLQTSVGTHMQAKGLAYIIAQVSTPLASDRNCSILPAEERPAPVADVRKQSSSLKDELSPCSKAAAYAAVHMQACAAQYDRTQYHES